MRLTDFPFQFGIEEEFFLAHPVSGELVRRRPRELVATLRRELGDAITPEMLRSQIEISSPILRDTAHAAACMSSLRDGLAVVLGRFDLCLVAAGTHPLGVWRTQSTTSKRRYRQMHDDYQILARRNLVCGLHVHVAIPEGVDRVALMNRAMPWLPVFLALSTSSPFWNRQSTGLLGYRQSLFSEWPRSGIPDFFRDQADYDAFVRVLQQAGALEDARSLWWGIRPSERYPTLELRIADACTRLQDSLAIAALFRCLVRLLLREPERGAPRSTMTRRLIDENRWRAQRHGARATFLREHGEPVPCSRVLSDLRRDCAEDADALDCVEALAALDALQEHGTSADAQLAIYQQRLDAGDSRPAALQQVLQWLMKCTRQTS